MIKNLSEREELALRDFLVKVAEHFKSNYLFSLMFGSKARGESHEGSDLDVAVVLEHVDLDIRRTIYALAYDELLENEVDISPVIFAQDVFERQKAAHFPLLREIERDMVAL
ncbi:MAG: nucleotidyltransferase domain-containing protein [Desulfuromonadales bacterium]